MAHRGVGLLRCAAPSVSVSSVHFRPPVLIARNCSHQPFARCAERIGRPTPNLLWGTSLGSGACWGPEAKGLGWNFADMSLFRESAAGL